jgi:hypothetical protein
VFAAILDRFPADSAAPAMRTQFEAGLGILADGIVHDVTTGTGAIDRAVRGWTEAADAARDLLATDNPALSPPLVKACVLGPWSAANASASGPRGFGAAAATVHDAVDALFEAGAPVVQLVEDGLASLDPNDAAAVAAAGTLLRTATREPRGHLSLSVGRGSVDGLGPAFFFDLPVASFAFDLINGPDNWRLIGQAPTDRGILCGVADCRTERDDEEAVMIWAARYAASTGGRGLERVALCPSSGLETLSAEAAGRKLMRLATAARKAGLPAEELASSIDPRAVDARSAALGRFDPSAHRSR